MSGFATYNSHCMISPILDEYYPALVSKDISIAYGETGLSITVPDGTHIILAAQLPDLFVRTVMLYVMACGTQCRVHPRESRWNPTWGFWQRSECISCQGFCQYFCLSYL